MPFPDVLSNTFLEFVYRAWTRGFLREHSSMDFLGTVTSSPPDNDGFTLFFPFEDGTGTDSEFSAYFEWH
jgi:hypothetical protein